MRKLLFLWGILAMSVVSAGCASTSYGTKLDEGKVNQIQKGATTRAQIEQMFGPPASVGLMGDGRRMMTYSYVASDTHVKGTTFIPYAGAFMGGSKGTMRNQQLQVILTKADIVEDYVFSDGTSNLDYSQGFGHTSMSSTPASTTPDK